MENLDSNQPATDASPYHQQHPPNATLSVHPAVSWQRIDEERFQIRVPSGQHLTFNKHSGLVERLVEKLRTPTLAGSLPEVAQNEEGEALDAIVGFLSSACIIVDDQNSPSGPASNIFDYHSRITRLGRIGVPEPFVSHIEVLGDGHLSKLVDRLVNETSSLKKVENEGRLLQVVCADDNDLSQMRELNKQAIENEHCITFIRWTGGELVIGPFVVPGESSCLECLCARRFANSRFRDEWEALLTKKPQFRPLGREAAFDSLVQFAVAHHLLAIRACLFNEAEPGTAESWNPLTGAKDVGRVLRVPRCPVCGNQGAPARAVRDLI